MLVQTYITLNILNIETFVSRKFIKQSLMTTNIILRSLLSFALDAILTLYFLFSQQKAKWESMSTH